MPQHPRTSSGLRDEVDPARREQAALEQTIERTQDEIDAAAIEAEPPEPEDAIDLASQERVFEMQARRNPRA